ncbi:hypothetical protein CN564_21475 [Bacillus pseudomycoides]|nr:hypothetical protein CN564_21475 [Bacillus pseudomycoides]
MRIVSFKGLNNNFFIEEDNEKKTKKENKSVISFVFSFNYDISFPVIGNNVTLHLCNSLYKNII